MYNRNDFIESFWLALQAAFDKIQNSEPAKSDLPKLIHLFYIQNENLRSDFPKHYQRI
jgi:hypothetical protein